MSDSESSRTPVEAEISAESLNAGVMIVVVDPGGSTEGHEHHSQELWVIEQGEGYVDLAGEHVALRPGPATSIPADTFHTVHNTGAVPLVLLAFWWKRI